ncbi:dockerin type I repeat-containing protein [Youngiibacter multivorans]|uniref:Dockerin domain-containing protein n=1 Tax=Youngiibacter multivorans TaxID=937251 RepID=A0ABS4G678_9CLOT|nr:dockerin type I repeat-containing protein [Youngiibacter multivorans]MBP1920033.1 hypothetical protein [Youngiibacter multivorans]
MESMNGHLSKRHQLRFCFLVLSFLTFIMLTPFKTALAEGEVLPHIHAWPLEDVVNFSSDGTDGMNCTIELYDSLENLKYSGSFTYDSGNPWIDVIPGDIDVAVGDRAVLSGAGLTRDMIVSDIAVTLVDVSENTVSGTTSSLYPIYATVFVEGGPYGADGFISDGNWYATFSAVEYVLKPGDNGLVSQIETDGDNTSVRWIAPKIATIMVFPYEGSLNFSDDGTSEGIYMIKLIRDAEIKFEGTFNYPSDEWLRFPEGVAIVPGDRITVEFNGLFRELIIPDLKVDLVDTVNDKIHGSSNLVSPVLTTIFFDGGQVSRTSEVIDGNFTADFSVVQGSEGTYDITSQDAGTVMQVDTDGDMCLVSFWAPNPALEAHTDTEILDGLEWKPSSNIEIRVYSSETVYETFNVNTNAEGFFEVDFGSLGIDLHGGLKLMVTDGMIDKVFILSALRFISADAENDLVNGYIEPGSYVQVIAGEEGFPIFREPVPDSEGYFIADFSVPDASDENTFDIIIGSVGGLRTYDGNNNATMVMWSVEKPILPGDVNDNDIVDKNDANLILRYLAGRLVLSDRELLAADYNLDGIVDKTDATLILKSLSKGKVK